MKLTVVTGGVRSGKSRWAQEHALTIGGQHVSVIATAEAIDAEMRTRIENHKAHRPAGWETIEASRRVGDALLESGHDVVVLDCLTVLAGNALALLEEPSEARALAAVRGEVDALIAALDQRAGTLIVVTNEVGLGVHPPTSLGRWFQDALGAANQRLVERAESAILMVSGVPVTLR